jgi:hypothetical protein
VNVNVEPAPTWLFTQIRPPWSWMNFRQRVSPRPGPTDVIFLHAREVLECLGTLRTISSF